MDEMAKEFDRILDADLKKDFPNAPKLKHTPHPSGNGEPQPPRTTVSQDIDALRAKLTVIARDIELLKGQL
jgi:hypothetical protein